MDTASRRAGDTRGARVIVAAAAAPDVHLRAPERRQRHVRGVRDLRAAASGRLMSKHCRTCGNVLPDACVCGTDEYDESDADEGAGDDAA